jgi:hypothetical protein
VKDADASDFRDLRHARLSSSAGRVRQVGEPESAPHRELGPPLDRAKRSRETIARTQAIDSIVLRRIFLKLKWAHPTDTHLEWHDVC